MAYEDGSIDAHGFFNLFASGIKSGQVWSLQGSYGRTAAHLIENGYITKDGELTSVAIGVVEDDLTS